MTQILGKFQLEDYRNSLDLRIKVHICLFIKIKIMLEAKLIEIQLLFQNNTSNI